VHDRNTYKGDHKRASTRISLSTHARVLATFSIKGPLTGYARTYCGLTLEQDPFRVGTFTLTGRQGVKKKKTKRGEKKKESLVRDRDRDYRMIHYRDRSVERSIGDWSRGVQVGCRYAAPTCLCISLSLSLSLVLARLLFPACLLAFSPQRTGIYEIDTRDRSPAALGSLAPSRLLPTVPRRKVTVENARPREGCAIATHGRLSA